MNAHPSNPRHILLSRTDSIGDVVLTLPLAGLLKRYFPGVRITFMGKSYTRPVIEACAFVDAFLDVAAFLNREYGPEGGLPDAIVHVFPVPGIARKAAALKIPWRIGTTSRLYHWTTCNKLVRLSRKSSPLHEAQLNVKLLGPFGIPDSVALSALSSLIGLNPISTLPRPLRELVSPDHFNLILHPKSQGSAREWGTDNFLELIRMLPSERYRIFISGTAGERESLAPLLSAAGDRVADITGKMDLATFMAFIRACDGLVANSTGPLHIAAAMGKSAIGIYPPMRPIHPGRWAPLGPRAQVMVKDLDCNDCRKDPGACHCIREITPAAIKVLLDQAAQDRNN